MNAEELRALAVAASSSDLVAQRDASSTLRGLLSPSAIVAAWKEPGQRSVVEGLLREVSEVGNADVYGVVCEALRTTLADPAYGHELLSVDHDLVSTDFILSALAGGSLALAAKARPAAVTLLSVALGRPEATPIGAKMDHLFRSDVVLRLFDCDAVETEENALVYRFLSHHTALVSFIFDSTAQSFDTDPLLLANYLVASGILSRHEAVPVNVARNVQDVLEDGKDELFCTFCCRFCSITLYQHEENASSFAGLWVPAAGALLGHCGVDTVDAVFDVLGAASTTAAGWSEVARLGSEVVAVRIRSLSTPARLSALQLLSTLMTSPFIDIEYCTPALLQEVWQQRTAPDVALRAALWRVVLAMLQSRNNSLRTVLATVCASFLCGRPREESTVVRDLQLRAANALIAHAELPGSTKEALAQFSRRGLYPPGSAGVAEMTKD